MNFSFDNREQENNKLEILSEFRRQAFFFFFFFLVIIIH